VSASAGGTFAGDVTFNGSFTSQGIDDNATSTAMTLDTSGNLLVGKASNSFGTTGVALNPDGSNNMTRSGDPALALNRLTSDGAILGLYKDGSNVGSIGVASSNTYIGSGDTGIAFSAADDTVYPITTATGGIRDAAIDLGGSTYRYKDLYLSGGVYLGGITSSNKLDDYEEGTFSPSIKGTTTNPTTAVTAAGYYTKVGNLVSVHIKVSALNLSGASGNFYFEGLPFSTASSTNDVGSVMHLNAITHQPSIVAYASGLQVYIYGSITNGSWAAANHTGNSSAHMGVTLTYRTDA
jgi:hypothetical protein